MCLFKRPVCITIIIIYLFFHSVPIQAQTATNSVKNTKYGQNIRVSEKDRNKLISIRQTLRKEALVFLGILKEMEPKLVEKSNPGETVEKVKIITADAVVRDNFYPQAKIIHYPFNSEEFVVIEEIDNYYCIELPQHIKGYIHETDCQYFSETSKSSVVTYEGIDKNEIQGLIAQLRERFITITKYKILADDIVQNYNITHESLNDYLAHYQKINRYYQYSKQFYDQFDIAEDIVYEGSKSSFLGQIKIWGEIMLGKESRTTQYVAKSAEDDELDGKNQTIYLGTAFNVKEDFDVELNWQNKEEIMLQKFKNSNLSGNMIYRGMKNLQWSLSSNLNSYQGPAETKTDFKNFNIGNRVSYQVSNQLNIDLNHRFSNYNYIEDDASNYKMNSILGRVQYNKLSGFAVKMNLLYTNESGDISNHQFSRFHPYLEINRQNTSRLLNMRIAFDTYNYDDFKEGNYEKLLAFFRWGSRYRKILLDGFYKTFPNKEISNYWRTRFRFSSNSNDLKKRKTLTIYNTMYPNSDENNHTNLRYSSGSSGRNFNIVLTAWHDAEANKHHPKPHILDIYSKIGIQREHFQIGPVIGLHVNLVFSEFEDDNWYERNGNLLRIGAFANVNYSVKKMRFILNSSYEYGNVFTNQYTGFNDNTGELIIDPDDPFFVRHPKTLQLNLTANYTINSYVDINMQSGWYQIKTDFDEIPGSYATQSNSNFYVVAGITFKRN